jgi:hypothetical protein
MRGARHSQALRDNAGPFGMLGEPVADPGLHRPLAGFFDHEPVADDHRARVEEIHASALAVLPPLPSRDAAQRS